MGCTSSGRPRRPPAPPPRRRHEQSLDDDDDDVATLPGRMFCPPTQPCESRRAPNGDAVRHLAPKGCSVEETARGPALPTRGHEGGPQPNNNEQCDGAHRRARGAPPAGFAGGAATRVWGLERRSSSTTAAWAGAATATRAPSRARFGGSARASSRRSDSGSARAQPQVKRRPAGRTRRPGGWSHAGGEPAGHRPAGCDVCRPCFNCVCHRREGEDLRQL